MRNVHGDRQYIAVFVVAILLSACTGGGASPSPSVVAATDVAATDAPSPGGGSPSTAVSLAELLPKPEQTKVTIGGTMTSTGGYGPRFANLEGYFEQYGLEVELIDLQGDAPTLQAVTAGQIDIGIAGSSNAIGSNIPGGDTPMSLLAVQNLVLLDGIWCTGGITSAEQLKGKAIAISTFGGVSHAAGVLAVEGLGLQPSDVVFTQVGNETERVAALQGGSVPCAMAAAKYPGTTMQDMKATRLFDLTDSGLTVASAAAFARKDWIAENPNTVLVVLAGMLQGVNLIFSDTPAAVKHYAEYRQISEEEAAEFIDAYKLHPNRTLMWDEAALEATLDVMASQRAEIKEVDLATVSDHTFLQKLVDLGVYDQLGIPLE
jgi:ABC-type nitrate/sulfonate/bicarbonate transport system substrate-binding protein